MSRTLLSRSLTELERVGVLRRREDPGGPVYELTQAGEELFPVLEAIGEWGVRWLSTLSAQDLDPAFLLWDMHRSLDPDALPEGRTVLKITFSDAHPDLRDWWLLMTADQVDVCDEDPGFETDVAIVTSLPVFARVWRGDVGWSEAVASGGMRLQGRERLRRRVADWFRLSHFSDVPRPA